MAGAQAPEINGAGAGHAWRSPPPALGTPLVQALPAPFSPPLKQDMLSPPPLGGKLDAGLHPSFLPPCDHSGDGDLHAHAFDLLSLSSAASAKARVSPPSTASSAVPASVPAKSFLTSSRPPAVTHASHSHSHSNGSANGTSSATASGSIPKARRMSSSTTGVLGRGKLGLTGEVLPGTKDVRPVLASHAASYTSSSPIPNRRPTATPTPQLFDFAKTDRPAQSRAQTSVPASLPASSYLLSKPAQAPADDIELDMAFDGDEEDEALEGDGDMDLDGEEGDEWGGLALGSGSGGVKGRRKGMVFKCETCKKEYRHPSCLVKHRWEHSPHWKEPTQIAMSKHQQVQMLEAAAILAHLDPNGAGALPTDKSLWPSILASSKEERRASMSHPRRPSHSQMRSPPSSAAPLTPASFRETSGLNGDRKPKERKSSPGSDSTTSSMGAGEPYVPVLGSYGVRSPPSSHRPIGINGHSGHSSSRVSSSISSSAAGPGTPHSIGSASLASQMARLGFASGATPTGASPSMRQMGNGTFGIINTAVPSSSVRSGADDLPEDDEEDDWIKPKPAKRDGKSSSEEAEERRKDEEYGMAMEMEL